MLTALWSGTHVIYFLFKITTSLVPENTSGTVTEGDTVADGHRNQKEEESLGSGFLLPDTVQKTSAPRPTGEGESAAYRQGWGPRGCQGTGLCSCGCPPLTTQSPALSSTTGTKGPTAP